MSFQERFQKSWWNQPSKIPPAPSWRFVWLFGAVWNAVIEQILWATIFCLVGFLLVPVIGAVKRKADARIDAAFRR